MKNIWSIDRVIEQTQMLAPIPDKKSLFLETLKIAWPSTLESFLISLVSLVDTMMVSGLGTYAISAVGLNTQPKFLAFGFFPFAQCCSQRAGRTTKRRE